MTDLGQARAARQVPVGFDREEREDQYGRFSLEWWSGTLGSDLIPSQDVRNFVAGTIGANAANKATLDANRAYVRKLNGLLVEVSTAASCSDPPLSRTKIKAPTAPPPQILQLDWPQEWPDFIDNLLLSSHSDPAQCENNFVILRMLSEAMHDFWETNLSMTRSQVLRGQLVSLPSLPPPFIFDWQGFLPLFHFWWKPGGRVRQDLSTRQHDPGLRHPGRPGVRLEPPRSRRRRLRPVPRLD